MRRETKAWLGRALFAAILAVALGYIPYHLYVHSGFARTLELRRDLASLRAHNAELRAETGRLGREAASLRDDLGAVERVARRELGWVRPGEVVFQVP